MLIVKRLISPYKSLFISSTLAHTLILSITLAAFSLRLAYLLNSHPFIDEFTTALAAQAIRAHGLPLLPSGLFYEHGLLFSYLDAFFVGLAGWPIAFAIIRLPSLFIGTALVPLIYRIGRRWFSPGGALVAATLFAISPEGMVWAGRARMYALAQLFILIMAFCAYEGSLGQGKGRLRWLALLALLAALLTQFGAILFVAPLLIGMLVVKWLTSDRKLDKTSNQKPPDQPETRPSLAARLAARLPLSSPEWVGLGLVVGVGVLVKRLGQPLGTAALGSEGGASPLLALWETLAYQAGLVLSYDEAVKFLARQFGVPHHLWLAIVAVLGALALIIRRYFKNQDDLCARFEQVPPAPQRGEFSDAAFIFLGLIFGLVVLEMITLLKPFRRNPRYLVIGLPLFYLITASSLGQLQKLGLKIRNQIPEVRNLITIAYGAFILSFIFLHSRALRTDLMIAYYTPEPAYEAAFEFVAAQSRPGDAVLSMNPGAAALYINQIDQSSEQYSYFAMQVDADQFLLNKATEPVDRWLGSPWLGTTADLNRVLNEHPQTWFVIDTIRLPVYYQGDWQAFLTTQMELVWAEDEALVYRTRSNRIPLPSAPKTDLAVKLGDQIELLGYSDATHLPTAETDGHYQLTLFWTALTKPTLDYTIFVHIREPNGTNVAQNDSQPLDGYYPTSQWRQAEIIIDPHQISLPATLSPGLYQVWVGMYQLETLTRLPVAADTSGENAVLLGELRLQ